VQLTATKLVESALEHTRRRPPLPTSSSDDTAKVTSHYLYRVTRNSR
jgi:hypothetical protein